MPSIELHSIDFHYDDPYVPIFGGVSATLDLTWKTAVVGRNGRGKTTLLRMIAGELEPRAGRLNVPLPVSRFPYEPVAPARPAREVVRDCVAPFAAWEGEMAALLERGDEAGLAAYSDLQERFQEAGGYEVEGRIEKEIRSLGMEPELLSRDFTTLSGGEKTRLLIAALFLRRGAFPLIDEPTNHLDLAGRELLGEWLAGQSGFILVSHDRHFLDLCADHLLAIDLRGVTVSGGSFSGWRQRIVEEELGERRQQEKLKREIKKLQRAARLKRNWAGAKERTKFGNHADRGNIGHRAAKQMKQSLIIQRRGLDKVEQKQQLLQHTEKERKLKLESPDGAPDLLLTLENAGIGVAGQVIAPDMSLELRRGERVALLGPNGCGKTLLLRTICGELPVLGGLCHLTSRLEIARAHQEPSWSRGALTDHLKTDGIDQTRFRQIMGCFGVSGAIFDRPLETFSQGERKKVELCRSFLDPAHLLIWDEPLNYIDLLSREQIEDVILSDRPTMLFVEHDRRFIENVATRVIELPPRGGGGSQDGRFTP